MRFHHAFHAMGTEVEVLAPSIDAAIAAQRGFHDLERRMSRFLAGSEIDRINTSTAETLSLSEELADVLHWAERLRDRTEGLVDVGVGDAVTAWGYDRSFEAVEGLDVPPDTVPVPRRWWVAERTLHRAPWTRFDLGGIGKGWAADRVLTASGASWINAGGDVASAEDDLEVEVTDPWGEPAVTIPVGRGGLATSSTVHRRWRVADRHAHHIIDPRTGAPAETPVLMATAVAATAVEAEAAAKAIIIRGTDGLEWAAAQPWIRGAVVIWRDGSVYATPKLEVAA